MTFSALADLLSAPSHRISSILHPQKYPKPGPVFGYKKAREQLIQWVTRGIQPSLAAAGLRDHEKEALHVALSMPGAPGSLLPMGTQSAAEPPRLPHWSVAGVDVSFFPDAIVQGSVGGIPATGAIKFYLRKDPTTYGQTFAALLYHYQLNVLRDPSAAPSLCMLIDVQAGQHYVASGSYSRLLKQVTSTCNVVAAMWPTL